MSPLRLELSGVDLQTGKNEFLTFEIPRKAFLIPHSYQKGSAEYCVLGITGELSADSDKIILGTNFMRSFYTGLGVDVGQDYYAGIHEGTPKIGFAQGVESLGIMQRGKQDNNLMGPLVKTILITLSVMLATALGVGVLAKARQNKRQRKLKKIIEAEDPNFLLRLNRPTQSQTFTCGGDNKSASMNESNLSQDEAYFVKRTGTVDY